MTGRPVFSKLLMVDTLLQVALNPMMAMFQVITLIGISG